MVNNTGERVKVITNSTGEWLIVVNGGQYQLIVNDNGQGDGSQWWFYEAKIIGLCVIVKLHCTYDVFDLVLWMMVDWQCKFS